MSDDFTLEGLKAGVKNASTKDADDFLAMNALEYAMAREEEEKRSKLKPLFAMMGEIKADITPEQMEARTAAVLTLPLPSFANMRGLYRGLSAIICGSGPSLDVEYVRKRQAEGARVFALNKTHDKLIENGIIPDFGVMLDPNTRVAGYMTPHRRVTYILGTSVDVSVWRKFLGAGVRPYYFMPLMTDENTSTMTRFFPEKDVVIIAGITTVGGRCINVAGWMGFEDQELHAFDSCYQPGKDGSDSSGLYAVDKPITFHNAREVSVRSRTTGNCFTCITNGAMWKQAQGFASILYTLPDSAVNGGADGRVGRIKLKVSGDGLIPWMAWQDGGPDKCVEHANPEMMTAKYGMSKHWDYFKGAEREESNN